LRKILFKVSLAAPFHPQAEQVFNHGSSVQEIGLYRTAKAPKTTSLHPRRWRKNVHSEQLCAACTPIEYH
jgi:hypothetical protein